MVALHFARTNQAGWECDACRKAGLEKKRRCGWLGIADDAGGPVVWARGRVAVTRCPKSLIDGELEGMVEEFLVRRRLGGWAVERLTARQVDGFVVLEAAIAEEQRDGERRAGNAV